MVTRDTLPTPTASEVPRSTDQEYYDLLLSPEETHGNIAADNDGTLEAADLCEELAADRDTTDDVLEPCKSRRATRPQLGRQLGGWHSADLVATGRCCRDRVLRPW